MKKAVVITLLLAFGTVVAIANISRKHENKTENKMDQQMKKKKDCSRTCLFS